MSDYDDSGHTRYNDLDDYGVEDVQDYNPGGFHPVHLGDILNDKYEVIHKLGNGGNGIVWLCYDIDTREWRALKILSADSSREGREHDIMRRLQNKYSHEQLERHHIGLPLSYFWIFGHNGDHLCFVQPFLGCTVSEFRWHLDDRQDAAMREVCSNLCRQIADGTKFLHAEGICHGDLRPDNVLMKMKGFERLSPGEMLKLLGTPKRVAVETKSGDSPGPRAPEYCVEHVASRRLLDMLTDEIAIIDFGCSFHISSPSASPGYPEPYSGPEVLLDRRPGLATDIWSLACTFYEVRTDKLLFSLGEDSRLPNEVCEAVHAMELYLGPLPSRYRAAFVDQGRHLGPGDSPAAKLKPGDSPLLTWSPDVCAQKRGEMRSKSGYHLDVLAALLGAPRLNNRSRDAKEFTYRKEEVLSLTHLLLSMLQYEVAGRISMDEVVRHPWLHLAY
ncbi:protein kinase-like protein [Xylariomycetidae sp. FL0641]|nr:protein kinase-like protein [Xylariomycetidae sp. FL0641]